jgi:hypothetical protein
MFSGDFTSYRLGDIVTLPDGVSRSIRMATPLPANELSLGFLVLLGELEMVLAPGPTGVHILLPVERMPPQLASAKRLCDGAAAYWSPHLPALSGAMGEVLYQLLMLRSSFTPVTAITRGDDTVFFARSGQVTFSDLRMLKMARVDGDETEVARYAAIVDPIAAPVRTPTPVPQRRIPTPLRR